MNERPLISVIVPVYNVEKYVGKCIESIVNQTYTNLEIVLVDDGSTDNSYCVCKEYAERDSRVVLVQKKNGGLASARNRGLEEVHGEFVGFVDSDDWVELDAYETMLKAALAYPNSVVLCGRFNVNEKTGEKTELFDFAEMRVWSQEEAIKRFLTWDKIDASVCDKLFPHRMLGQLRFPEGLVSEDVPFTYAVLKQIDNIVHIGSCKYNYLQRGGSITHSSFSEKSKGLLKYPHDIREDVLKSYPALNQQADYYCFSRAIIYLERLYMSGGKETEQASVLRDHFFLIFRNHFFSISQKVKVLLISTHTFWIAAKIKSLSIRGDI